MRYLDWLCIAIMTIPSVLKVDHAVALLPIHRETITEISNAPAGLLYESTNRLLIENNPGDTATLTISIQDTFLSLDARVVTLDRLLARLSDVSGIPITLVDREQTSLPKISISLRGVTIASALNAILGPLPGKGYMVISSKATGNKGRNINHIYVTARPGRHISQRPADVNKGFYDLFLLFDSSLAHDRHDLALELYNSLLAYQVDGARWLLALIQESLPESDKTLKAACRFFRSVGDADIAASAHQFILRNGNVTDWVKIKCIDELAQWPYTGIDQDLRTLSLDNTRDVNLRIVALREYKNVKGDNVKGELISLLRREKEHPAFRHKVIQYLAAYDSLDVNRALEGYVFGSDNSANSALAKEYSLLILKRKLSHKVVPILAEVLESPDILSEVKATAIDLLGDPSLQGGKEILERFLKKSQDPSLLYRATRAIEGDRESNLEVTGNNMQEEKPPAGPPESTE